MRRVVGNGTSGSQVLVTRTPGYMLVVEDDAFDAGSLGGYLRLCPYVS
jgi:hypothetical protein